MLFPEKRVEVMPGLVIRLRFAWWFAPYVHTLAMLCNLMGTEPNIERVQAVARRAIQVRIRNTRWFSMKAWLRRYG